MKCRVGWTGRALIGSLAVHPPPKPKAPIEDVEEGKCNPDLIRDHALKEPEHDTSINNHGGPLKRQKEIEEENKRRKQLLAKAIAERYTSHNITILNYASNNVETDKKEENINMSFDHFCGKCTFPSLSYCILYIIFGMWYIF